MQSAHCQLRVKNAISNINGASINGITPGVASLSLSDNAIQKNVTDAIEQAGYMISAIESSGSINTLTFKTNINCSGCVAQVKPVLDASKGINEWNVDTTSADKVLTIKSSDVSKDEIIDAITRAGFKIESLNN